MYTFIGIESVAANALIELFEKREVTDVSFDALVRYGMQIVRILKERSDNEVILLLSRKYQIDMVENYSNFFDADFARDNAVFRLKGADKKDKKRTLEELKDYFRWTMSVRVLEAFMSEDALQALGIS